MLFTSPRVQLERVINRWFLSRLMASPRGRAFMLSYMAEAEEADEQGVFDTLIARVDDPRLRQLVRKHRDDEVRHAGMLRAAVARIGVSTERVPERLRIVPELDRMLGGLAARFVANRQGVMEAYVLLQVVEERAVLQWPALVDALRGVDAASAETVASIVRDEQRHVKYARAISRKYAPDLETLERTLAHIRRVEARAFQENAQAFLRFTVEHDLLAVHGLEKRVWQLLASVMPAPTVSPVLEPSGAH